MPVKLGINGEASALLDVHDKMGCSDALHRAVRCAKLGSYVPWKHALT